jgi:hypothetical protein
MHMRESFIVTAVWLLIGMVVIAFWLFIGWLIYTAIT